MNTEWYIFSSIDNNFRFSASARVALSLKCIHESVYPSASDSKQMPYGKTGSHEYRNYKWHFHLDYMFRLHFKLVATWGRYRMWLSTIRTINSRTRCIQSIMIKILFAAQASRFIIYYANIYAHSIFYNITKWSAKSKWVLCAWPAPMAADHSNCSLFDYDNCINVKIINFISPINDWSDSNWKWSITNGAFRFMRLVSRTLRSFRLSLWFGWWLSIRV